MKRLFGGPGTMSGLMLRLGQCAFGASSIGLMVTSLGFSSYTAFCFLVGSMGVQVLWSFVLACVDIYALSRKICLCNPYLLRFFVIFDWELLFLDSN